MLIAGAAAQLLVPATIVAIAVDALAAAGPARMLAPGLEYRELGGTSFTLAVLEVDPKQAAIRVLDARRYGAPGLNARELVEKSGALAAVNASFFDERGAPLGLVVSDRQVRNPLRKVDWGVFFISNGRARIVHTRGFRAEKGVDQAVQVGPRLVIGGRVARLKPQTARRTVVGVDRSGRVYLAVTRRGAADAADLARLLARSPSEGGLGLVDALAMDGGGSTQLYLRAGGVEVDEPGASPVPIFLTVFPPRQSTQSVPERVNR